MAPSEFRSQVMDVLTLVAVVAAIVAFDLAAVRYGADSRDGFPSDRA
jgi:hypothetical protein